MSVIVATRGFMLADRRVSDDTGARLLPQTKVFKSKFGLLAGAAGNLTALLAVRDALKAGAGSPIDLVDLLDEESEALAVQGGKIYYISHMGVNPVSSKVHAIGSGADAALGYLAGAKSQDEAVCRRALRFVFTRRSDCGDGIRLVRP